MSRFLGLQKGIDVDAMDKLGNTPIAYAAMNKHDRLVDFLVTHKFKSCLFHPTTRNIELSFKTLDSSFSHLFSPSKPHGFVGRPRCHDGLLAETRSNCHCPLA